MKTFFCALLILLTIFAHEKVQASEKDIYQFSWLDPDKEVFVLQNRKYRKAGHLYLNLGGGITTSGAFVDSTAFQGRLGYFFNEDFGIEGIYSLNSGKENLTAEGVRSSGGGTGSTPFRRIVQNYYGAMALWSPFYSKINTFNSIVYMDWIFGVGFGQLQESNNKIELVNGYGSPETVENHTGLLWEAGMMFYISDRLNARVDLTAIHYSALNVKTTGSSIKSNFDTTVSLGYSF